MDFEAARGIRAVAGGEAAHSVQGRGAEDCCEVAADVALDVDGEVCSLLVDGRGEDFDRHAEEADLGVFGYETGTGVPRSGLPEVAPVADLGEEDDVFGGEVLARGVLEEGFGVDEEGALEGSDGVEVADGGGVDFVEEFGGGVARLAGAHFLGVRGCGPEGAVGAVEGFGPLVDGGFVFEDFEDGEEDCGELHYYDAGGEPHGWDEPWVDGFEVGSEDGGDPER